jgi:hypothetical protein
MIETTYKGAVGAQLFVMSPRTPLVAFTVLPKKKYSRHLQVSHVHIGFVFVQQYRIGIIRSFWTVNFYVLVR